MGCAGALSLPPPFKPFPSPYSLPRPPARPRTGCQEDVGQLEELCAVACDKGRGLWQQQQA